MAINYVSDDERAERCAQHIMNDCGGGRSRDYLQGRCHDYGQVRDMVSTVVTTAGGLDAILVNNAFARYSFDPRNRKTFPTPSDGPITRHSSKDASRAHTTPAKAALPQMRRQAGGRVINISSNLVDSPIVPYHDYTAAKGALVGFTRSLAQEAGAWGVTVNAIAAGLTIGTESSRATTEDVRERIIASTPLGRLATADDIAGAVAMLRPAMTPHSSLVRPCMSTGVGDALKCGFD